ncbi:MAG: type I restriction enzyme HsdR N-terminal domain-containing protein [Alphaproteobacteria bacterium]|nr:type I restriction enzyme HsdR N-terminal domain-containing protein [Alphaproteobacteria bacterium]
MNVKGIFERYKVQIDNDKIYDPIRQNYVHLTPEEFVRQKTIKFLIKRLGVPQSKIIVERSLNTLGVKGVKRRIDIGVLDEENLLIAVVECKASLSKNGEAAFIQAQDYLLKLNTRYFFITDGETFSGWYYDTIRNIPIDTIPKYNRWYYYPTSNEDNDKVQ